MKTKHTLSLTVSWHISYRKPLFFENHHPEMIAQWRMLTVASSSAPQQTLQNENLSSVKLFLHKIGSNIYILYINIMKIIYLGESAQIPP